MSGSPRRLVLVVEDEPAIADVLVMALEHAGYSTAVARDGDEAVAAVRARRPALVLLDIGLPGTDGLAVCRALRAADDWTPVVFVTARDDEIDRVVGIELGADDYVVKPFSPREVTARVGAILRRADRREQSEPGQERSCGAVRMLLHERRVLVEDREVALTATEFDLLAHLLEAPGRVFSRGQLMSAVWGYDSPAGERTVDVHVAQVRAKIAPHEVIRTVRGVGYAAVKDGG